MCQGRLGPIGEPQLSFAIDTQRRVNFASMQGVTRLDEITLFNGKLTFLIPHEWQEIVEGEDLYCYGQPGASLGWLRVSLNTTMASQETSAETLNKIVEGKNAARNERTGNCVWTRERNTKEDGVPIHLFYWFVVNVAGSSLVREAIFSYTVLEDRKNEEETQSLVELIAQIAGLARFNSEAAPSGNTAP